jgi:hypothetical protein
MSELTKWPRLLVAGQPVSEQQANDILIRTDSWSLIGNDRQWGRVVADAIGVTVDSYGLPDWQAVEAFRKTINALRLGYLYNSQIYSSWIGGPHGWCSWSGRIGCSNYNIGKWPSTDEVSEEWTAIAGAFPYLNLTAQLVSDEGEGQLVGQWTVRDGAMVYDAEPTEQIRPAEELGPLDWIGVFSSSSGRERGVELARLVAALEQVRGGAS